MTIRADQDPVDPASAAASGSTPSDSPPVTEVPVPSSVRSPGWLAWAGRQAMRPQMAAGALLVLILGSSVLFLRPQRRLKNVGRSPSGLELEEGALPSRPPPPPPTGSQDPLLPARTQRESSGCAAALPSFEAVALRHAGTETGATATWEQAECWRALGDRVKARALYEQLRAHPSYGPRAAEALASP